MSAAPDRCGELVEYLLFDEESVWPIDVEEIRDSRSTFQGVFEQMSERTIAISDVPLNGELDHCWQRRSFVCRSVSVVRSDQQSRGIRLDKLGINNVVCDKGLKSRRSDKYSSLRYQALHPNNAAAIAH